MAVGAAVAGVAVGRARLTDCGRGEWGETVAVEATPQHPPPFYNLAMFPVQTAVARLAGGLNQKHRKIIKRRGVLGGWPYCHSGDSPPIATPVATAPIAIPATAGIQSLWSIP